MVYVLVGLALLLVIAVIFGASQASAAAIRAKENVDLKKQIADMVSTRLATKAANELELGRRELVIASLKAEIENLEKDLAANRDPTAVRSRLSKLLSDP